MNIDNKNEKTLSVLSLNCWGLYLVSKQRKFRLRAIAEYLSRQSYDIVALQECWMRQDFEYIKNRVEAQLPYAKYFLSGTLGCGLVILSKYPILASSLLKFTLAGRPLMILEGDYYVGKACGSVTIDHPEIGLIDVFTSHLLACYEDNDIYEAQRITECWQIANSIRASAAQGRHVILAGDFNSIPSSNCYQILKNHGFMTDSWLEINEQNMKEHLGPLERKELSPKECIQIFGITCDSPVNTWTKHLFKQESYEREVGDRLDYIHYRRTPQITCQQSKVVMDEHIPDTEWNYSDHYGVHSIFTIVGQANRAIGEFAPVASQLARPEYTSLSTSTLYNIMDVLQLDLQRGKKTANGYMALFGCSVFAVIAAFVAQIVLPIVYSENEQSILVSTVVCGFVMIAFTALALISLMAGFVFGGTEQRSLTQYLSDFQAYVEVLHQQEARRASFVSETESDTMIHKAFTAASNNDGESFSSSFSSNANSDGTGLVIKHTEYLKK